MRGKHHIILETRKIKYEFDVKRNITIVKGDSATGKTTLVNLLAEYARFGETFAEMLSGSSNYYVLITREPMMELPYSISEIYGIRTVGKFHYPEKIYNEFYPIYDSGEW